MSQASITQPKIVGGSQTFYGPTIIMFILMGLLAGALLREVNKKFGIPYSPMLLFLGILLGVYHQTFGYWGHSAWLIEQIHPHTGLQIFVPTLMFTGALGCNYYLLKKSLTNILILSIPGAIIGAIAMGVIIKGVLGYTDEELSWYQAITLGCALSSTDPVAVVTLLKELGSSVKFNTLIEGQSLISGSVSTVIYMVFLAVANHQTTTVAGFVTDTVRISLGGIIVGLFFGIIVSYWLKKIIRDQTLSIVITIIGSYLSFHLCEFTWLRFSGVVAVVIQGIYLAGRVKRKIYAESQQALQTVWGTMGYCAQTIVFILGGVIAGIELSKYNTITSNDWIKLLAFWVIMILVRAVIIYAFYPILKSRGYGLSKKELVILIYGGLKGALGLSLAMMITVDDYYPTRFRQLATFYMAGMVVMTVIINGLTTKKVLDYVEMIHVPEIKIKLFKRCVKEVLNNTRTKLDELKNQPDLVYAQWRQVQDIAEINKLGNIETESAHQRSKQVELRDSFVDIKQSEMVQEIRFRFTRYLKKTYWKFYEEGQVSEESIRILSENCDIVNDNSQERLNYFDLLNGALDLQSVKIFTYFKDWALIGPFFTRMLVSKIYFVYEVSLIFVESSEQTIRIFKNDFPLNNDYLGYVIEEVKDNIDQAVSYINDLQNTFPEVIQVVHTRRAATILLKNKRNNLKKMFEEGFIDDLQYQALRKQVDTELVNAHFVDLKLQLRINEVLLDCPLFSTLSKAEISNIKNKSSQRVFQKEDKILTANGEIDYVYIIVSGSVKEQFENFYLIKGTGNVINPYDVTLEKDSKCNAIALNNVKVMQIKHEIIQELLKNNVEFRKKWYKSVFIYETYFNKNLEFLHKNNSEKQFRRFVSGCEIKILKAGEKDFNQESCYLFDGQIESDGTTYSKGGNVVPKEKMIKALTDSIIIKFRDVPGVKINQNLRLSHIKEQ